MYTLLLIIKNIFVIVILKITDLIWSKPKSSNIHHLIDYGYHLVQYNMLHIEYSWEEYQQQRIPRTYQSLRRPFLILLNGLLAIIFLATFVCFEDNTIFISIKYLEKIIDCQRLDLLYIASLVLFGITEWTWFNLFIQIITYRSPLHKIVNKSLYFDDKRLALNYRRYLYICYLTIMITGWGFCGLILFGVVAEYFMHVYFITQSYIDNQITIIQLLFSIIIFFQIFFNFLFFLFFYWSVHSHQFFLLNFLKYE